MTEAKYRIPEQYRERYLNMAQQFPPEENWLRFEKFLADPTFPFTRSKEPELFCELIAKIPLRENQLTDFIATQLYHRYHANKSDSQQRKCVNLLETLMVVHAFPSALSKVKSTLISGAQRGVERDEPDYLDRCRPAVTEALHSKNVYPSRFMGLAKSILKRRLYDQVRADYGRYHEDANGNEGNWQGGRKKHEIHESSIDEVQRTHASPDIKIGSDLLSQNAAGEDSVRNISGAILSVRQELKGRDRDVFDEMVKRVIRGEQINNREMGEELGVNESRISQLRAKIKECFEKHAPHLSPSYRASDESPPNNVIAPTTEDWEARLELAIKSGDFPTEIKARRMLLNVSQPEIAERIGVHANRIRAWESGREPVYPIQLAALASSLEIDVSQQSQFIERGWQNYDRLWLGKPAQVKSLRWMITLHELDAKLTVDEQKKRAWKAFDEYWNECLEQISSPDAFHEIIQANRMLAHLNLDDLSKRISISKVSIINWEKDVGIVSPQMAFRYANALFEKDHIKKDVFITQYISYLDHKLKSMKSTEGPIARLEDLRRYEKEAKELPEDCRNRLVHVIWNAHDDYWQRQLEESISDNNACLELRARRNLKHLSSENLSALSGVERDYILTRENRSIRQDNRHTTIPQQDILKLLDVDHSRREYLKEALMIPDGRDYAFKPPMAPLMGITAPLPVAPPNNNTTPTIEYNRTSRPPLLPRHNAEIQESDKPWVDKKGISPSERTGAKPTRY
jgi:transcriptional regulator with XRE-family HTH domain